MSRSKWAAGGQYFWEALRFLATVAVLIFLVKGTTVLGDVVTNQEAGRQRTYQTQAGQCQLLRILGQADGAFPKQCWTEDVQPLWIDLPYVVIGAASQHEKTQRCIAQITEAINSRSGPIETECTSGR